MDERLRFVVECLSGDETMVALCAAHEISRKTGYKWLGRYRELGPEGLHDLPRAPLNHGRATALDLVERIVATKETHPLWSQEDRGAAQAHGSRAHLAVGLDGGGDPCAAWACQRPQTAASAGLRQWTVAASREAECGVDWRSQGVVPDP